MARKQIAWSWTRLECFEQCPKKFQGTYITKEFPKGDFDKPHFRKGKAIHKALEDYLNHGTKMPYPIVVKQEEFFVDLSFLYPLLNKMKEAPEQYIETNICLDSRLKELSWYDKKAWCRIIFDAVIIFGDFALVIDWKSGKVKDLSDQLKLFAGGVFNKFPQVNRVLSAYVWAEYPKSPPTWAEYTRLDMDGIWQEFGDRAELIQMANESGNWPAKKNVFCGWCDALPSQCEFKPDDY